jgi:hypothetical protein
MYREVERTKKVNSETHTRTQSYKTGENERMRRRTWEYEGTYPLEIECKGKVFEAKPNCELYVEMWKIHT